MLELSAGLVLRLGTHDLSPSQTPEFNVCNFATASNSGLLRNRRTACHELEMPMFTLNIPANTANLAAIKAELLTSLPKVKSSHRCEALGRGLGFESYASAREASKRSSALVTANGAAFRDYLGSRGFPVLAIFFIVRSPKSRSQTWSRPMNI
ncbi:hypothetical protein [Rhizobium gallicum]|uniref:hypothetical protein n=1 Tax=Rhizobium gallicum TaxID=56730 RepID=UPI001EF7A039|nr:hypothetical protein [Rhizobium gallicum]ULJ75892.1 hypothetical protein L2W42_25690 [Rhizobium gallicum]